MFVYLSPMLFFLIYLVVMGDPYGLGGCFISPTPRAFGGLDLILLSFVQAGESHPFLETSMNLTSSKRCSGLWYLSPIAGVSLLCHFFELDIHLPFHYSDDKILSRNRLLNVVYTDGALQRGFLHINDFNSSIF